MRMTINERLEFFKEMLRCNYDVYLWTYTPELGTYSYKLPSGSCNQ